MGCAQSVTADPAREIPDKAPKLKQKKSSNYSYLQLQETSTGMYVISPRTKMKLQVTKNEDFLSHHLNNELCLSPYASSEKIRARQIIQHYMFNDLSHCKVAGDLSTSKLTEFALKAWFQRTFLDCLQRAEHQYFQQNLSYDAVRQRIAQQYAFEIYKMGQFINAGLGKFGDGKHKVKIPLSLIFLNSDSALYPLLTKLQQKYPLVQQNQDITFPQVKPMTQNINVLKLFNSKCFTDPTNLNIQTTFDDLKFLIDEANDVFPDFRKDMIQLLGSQALTDCKVKRSKIGDSFTYNASAVRRVFIKWCQTLIERIPDSYLLSEFLDFIRAKKKMADHFIFKSIISETTHQQVIKCLSELLQSIKYQIGSIQPRQEFGLFLYDMLRCKTTRKTGQEIVALLDNLKNTKITASGKLFQVVRIKNRFKNATRDILINFRYGEHLVGQAQLCIDSSHDSAQISKRIKFRHYLYELERGLFGPTFELIMQYEDSSRKDIQVNMKATGIIRQRKLTKEAELIKKAGRLCPQRHEMIAIKGNIFSQNKFSQIMEDSLDTFNCDFCFQDASFSKEYHYCYYCTVFYCLKCLNVYKNTDFSRIELSCHQRQLITNLASSDEIATHCKSNKAIILVAYKQGKPACKLFLDQIVYLLSTYASQGRELPKIYTLSLRRQSYQQILKKFQITRLPTTMLLNERQEPLLTLVGSTFHDVEGIFEVEKRIKNNLPKGIKMKCNICSELLSSDSQYSSNKDEKCQICMDLNKIEDIEDLKKSFQFSHKDFICKNGHVRCGYCSYLSSNSPSYFRDHTGRSYLSNKIALHPPFCSKNHLMNFINQPRSFNCFKCHQTIEVITDQEIGFCSDCQEYLCNECFESNSTNFTQQQLKQSLKSGQIVSHFVEDQAQQAWPCGCGSLFLKVYQSKKRDKFQKFNFFKDLIMHRQQKVWKCFVCQQKSKQLKLHLACFYCSYAEALNGEISHVEICMNCCMKSGLINRREPSNDCKQERGLKCSKGHDAVYTRLREGNETFFECINCKLKFYSNTERYECQACNFKCCKLCSSEYLLDANLPVTDKICKKKHELIVKKQKPKLQFCQLCHKYLQGIHFKCSQNCRYSICTSCARS